MSNISNPYLRALLEPEQKAEPVAVDYVDYDDDDLLELLLSELADHDEDEEEPTKTADELPDNLAPCEVFPVGGLPPLSPAMPMQWQPTAEEEPAEEDEEEPATPRPLCNAVYEYATAYTAKDYEAPKEENKIIKYDSLIGFAECDILGLKWLQNKSGDGGAMKKIKEYKLPNNILIARIHQKYIQHKLFRTYGQCTPNTLLPLLANSNDLYEVIDRYPFKPYFDIDEPQQAGGSLDINDHLPKYMNVINELFKDADIAVCGNITTEKISFHIVIHNYLVRYPEERDQLKIIAKHIKADEKVYSSSQLMRQINQSKPLQNRPLRIIQGEPKKHIITGFFEVDALYFPNWRDDLKNNDSEHLTIIKMDIQTHKMTTSFNIAKQPKAILNKSIDFDIFTATPLQLLEIAPLGDDNDHEYTARIATFCKYNNVDFEDFINWRLSHKKLHDESEEKARERWRDFWDYKAKNYKPMNIQNFIWLILQDCPSLHIDKHFRDFKNLFNMDNMQGIDRLKVEQLNIDILENTANKYVCLHIGMSGGKTYNTMKYLKECGRPWAWLSPNIALATNTHYRMTADGMKVLNYKDQHTPEARSKIKDADAVICCLNSIHYLADPYNKSYNEGKDYKIIVIDEIESFLLKWFDNSTLNNTKTDKRALWFKFLALLRNAEKVIFLDAFLSRHTLEFIKSIEAETIPLIITRHIEETPRSVQFIENKPKFDLDLLEDLKQGKKIFIFYPYKNRQEHKKYLSMEELSDFLIKEVKEATGKELKGKYYHGETDQKENRDLYNVNESWDGLDFVICNNKITVGVSFEGKKPFDIIYIGIAGMNAPRDILQVSYRPRQLNNELIKICFFDRFNTRPNYKADEHYITGLTGENCPIYNDLVKNILKEKNAPIQQSTVLFTTMAKYKIIDGDNEANEIIKKKVRIYLEQNAIKYSFDDVRDIRPKGATEHIEAEEYHLIQIYKGEATTREQMEYKKYKFYSDFIDLEDYLTIHDCDPENIKLYIEHINTCDELLELEKKNGEEYEMPKLPIKANTCKLWDNEYNIKMSNIWNCRAFETMEAIQDIRYNKESRDYKIFNEFKKMFDGEYIPTADHLNHIIKKKVKLNDDLLNLIFGDKFRSLTKKSSTIHIIKGYYNMTLKRNIIKTKKDKGGHTIAEIHPKSLTIIMDILAIQRQKMGDFSNTETDTDQSPETEMQKLLIVEDDDITTNEDY